MIHAEKLISFHIAEQGTNNHKNFLTWTYPTIAEDVKKYILAKIFSESRHNGNDYFCFRKNSNWIYIKQDRNSNRSNKNFAVVLISKDFEPNKYKPLCDILLKKYLKGHNPVELVKLYLSLFISGSCSLQENGTNLACDFTNFKSVTNLKSFISAFQLEIILLYTAILLKRRLLLFNGNCESLYNDLLAASRLVPYRRYQDFLYPLVNTPKELKGLSFYVAGTTNGDLKQEESMYDLFVDMQTCEITISSKAEEIMTMTKTHKEIATFLVKLSESELSADDVEEQILKKTSDVLSLLKNLGSVTTKNNTKLITFDDLRAKNYHPTLENFLFNLAVAENIMML